MRKLHVFACLPALLAATLLPAADTRPGDDPKEAIRAFLTAPDEGGLRGALIVSPETREGVEPLIDILVATTRLQRAAESQYGSDAKQYFSASTKAQLDARLKTLDAAAVRINGDTATVDLPADASTRQSAGTVHLQRVNGEWKIDAASMLGIKPGDRDRTARQAAMARTLTGVTEQMIKDIQANKFASASDAYKEYWNRSREALRAGSAGTQPATIPAGGAVPATAGQ